MALTSSTDSLSTIPTSATPNLLGIFRAHAIWLAALAVWFWQHFEVRISVKHLCALLFGLTIVNVAIIALAVSR